MAGVRCVSIGSTPQRLAVHVDELAGQGGTYSCLQVCNLGTQSSMYGQCSSTMSDTVCNVFCGVQAGYAAQISAAYKVCNVTTTSYSATCTVCTCADVHSDQTDLRMMITMVQGMCMNMRIRLRQCTRFESICFGIFMSAP